MRIKAILLLILTFSFPITTFAKDITLNDAPSQVYFSPHGGCTEAIVNALSHAKTEVLVQAYSFTSAPIAKALVEAHKRGVHVEVVLDKSNKNTFRWRPIRPPAPRKVWPQTREEFRERAARASSGCQNPKGCREAGRYHNFVSLRQ